MADKPTIEEAKAVLAAFKGEGRVRLNAAIDTLLASHASLDERVKEAKRLTNPAVKCARLSDLMGADDAERMSLSVGELRALAAFVNEKERT